MTTGQCLLCHTVDVLDANGNCLECLADSGAMQIAVREASHKWFDALHDRQRRAALCRKEPK
jgi:hypothetical protein